MSLKNTSLSGNANTLTRVPGVPDPNVINKINELVRQSQIGNNYTVVEGSNQGSSEFPYKAFVNDSYDSIAQLKYQISRGNYKVPFEKVDAEYLLRQRGQVENADYDRWVMQKYDLSNPAQNMMLQKIDPDQFKRRMDLLKKQIDLTSRYAEVRMLGPKSEEDLKFEWLIESGRIQMPEGPLWDPQRWMEQQLLKYQYQNDPTMQYPEDEQAKSRLKSLNNRQRFAAALFDPLRYPREGETGWQSNRSNLSDIRGIDLFPTQRQLFEGSNAQDSYLRFGVNPIKGSDVYEQASTTAGIRFGAGYQRANVIPAVGRIPEVPLVPEIRDATGAVIQGFVPGRPEVPRQPERYTFKTYPPMSLPPNEYTRRRSSAYKRSTFTGYGNNKQNI